MKENLKNINTIQIDPKRNKQVNDIRRIIAMEEEI